MLSLIRFCHNALPFMCFSPVRGWRNQRGATAIEYALIAALIAVGIIAGATTVGDEIASLFEDDIAPALTNAGSGGGGGGGG